MPDPDSRPAEPWWRRPLALQALLTAAVAVVYLPALAAGWTNWDDQKNFLENPDYRGLGWTQLKWMWTTRLLCHYTPITWMTLGLDYVIWGMNPLGYHLTSLLIHAVNAGLLYRVLQTLLRRVRADAPAWPAAVGALFYSLHPLRVESVVWVTERRDVLCGFFALLSIWAWLKRVEEERAGRAATKWLALSMAAFAASLLSKSLSVMLPVVLVLMDVYPLKRWTRENAVRLAVEKAGFFLLSLIDGIIMIFAAQTMDQVRPVGGYQVAERAAQAAYGLCFYLVKTLWPSNLIALYRIDTPLNPWQAKYIVPMIAVAALTALLIVRRKRWPGALAAWAAYVVLVLPVLGVVVTGFQIAADRYTYLALMPAAALVAAGLMQVPAAPRLPILASGLVLSAFASVTVVQIGVWKDSITLWTHMIEVDAQSSLAYNSRGDARYQRGDYAGALEDCTRAIELDAGSADAYLNRGLALAQQGNAAAAIRDFDRVVGLAPKRADGWQNRGVARFALQDFAGALADLNAAAERDDRKPEIYQVRGSTRASMGDLAGAVTDFERALTLAPADWARRRYTQGLLDLARRKLRGD